MKRILLVVSMIPLALASSTVQSASASDGSSLSPEQVAADYLAEHPGGVLVSSREVAYPDGSGFVAAETSTMSLSECSSGRFCMWSSTYYSGSFTYVSGTTVTRTIGHTVKSFWNNRSYSARLYNNTGTSSVCYPVGDRRATLDLTYQVPSKVYLSGSSSC